MFSPLAIKVWFLIWILFKLCISATDPRTDTSCIEDPKLGANMFSMCMCARFQASPRESHLKATKKILRYLKHTQNVGLWYPKGVWASWLLRLGLCGMQGWKEEHLGYMCRHWRSTCWYIHQAIRLEKVLQAKEWVEHIGFSQICVDASPTYMTCLSFKQYKIKVDWHVYILC